MGKQLKVLLLHPGNQNSVEVAIHKRLLKKDFVYPPLGILSIASWLRRHQPQHQLQVLDLQLAVDEKQALVTTLERLAPDVVGLTLYTNQLMAGLNACTIIRKVRPEAKIVVGGPHLRLYPKETLQFEQIDYGVIGEGEKPFSELLQHLAADRPAPDHIHGLLWRKQGTIIQNPPASSPTDLDDLCPPARDLLPWRKYHMLTGRQKFCTTAVTSRGCPYRCTFCDVPKSRIRFFSPQWVVDDVKACLSLGIREIHFFDDMFNQSPQRVLKITKAFADNKLAFDWSFRGRVDHLDGDMLRQARRTGCYRVYLGLESGSDRILGQMKKGFTVDQIKAGVAQARKAGLEIHGYFMVGYPQETLDEMNATVELARSLDLDYAQFSVTTYLPGTEIYRQALDQGVLKNDVWRHQALDPRPDFKAPVAAASTIGEEAIWRFVNTAYRRFYFRPKIIWKNLKSIRDPHLFLRRARGATLCFTPQS